MIRVGTAGWHYDDWNGIVYPKPRPRDFDPLAALSRIFDALEVNVTFYRIPDPSVTASWPKRVAANPRFRFTVKLPRSFTHARDGSDRALKPPTSGSPSAERGTLSERTMESAGPLSPQELDAEERRFRAAIGPLLDAGRLGAILVQFPQSFHHTKQAIAILEEILDRFSDLPCVAEFRHADWACDEAISLLRGRRAGFCNIDQPRLASTLPPTEFVTGPVAYVRLHGRNAAEWFGRGQPAVGAAGAGKAEAASMGQVEAGRAERVEAGGAGRAEAAIGRSGETLSARRSESGAAQPEPRGEAPGGAARRYDYLYSEKELAPWIASIRRMAEQGADTYVIANNHFRGKAAVNALQIKAALEGAKVEVPETLLAAYPRLAPIAKPIPGRLPFE